MKKTSTKVSDKKIAQLQAQINIIQSEIDILRGDCVEFKSVKEAKEYFEDNY